MDSLPLTLTCDDRSSRVRHLLQGYQLQPDQVSRLQQVFEQELESGLQHSLAGSCLQMENTYVPQLPNGREHGLYLALDLGGTNFRVMLLQMQQGRIVREEVQYYTVPEPTRLGPGLQLFDFLASCIQNFLSITPLDSADAANSDQPIPLGFTFSFPMTQMGMDKGILVNWTKSFNCSGVIGEDAALLLSEAIKRLPPPGVPVKVVAILNDATGTLVKGAYDRPHTRIGLILGTGCNGAYIEQADRVRRWHGSHRPQATEVIIDPEFGAFGDHGCIDFLKTQSDRVVDQQSLLPGSFTYEKYFAGKYIGQHLRLIMNELCQNGLLFAGLTQPDLSCPDSVTSQVVSDIVADVEPDMEHTTKLVRSLGVTEASLDDLKVIKWVCDLLSERCGLMVAVPLATFIKRTPPDVPLVGIAVTGSLYKLHPKLKNIMEKYIGRLAPGRPFETFLSDDGSGKGAALVAAIGATIAATSS